jgi:hypothetical protein
MPRFVSLLLGSSAALAAVLTSERASAHGLNANVFMPVGLSTGYSLHDTGPNGALLGPELSVVHITSGAIWYGGYADFVWDLGSDRQRLSIGPEFGLMFFGIDGGYVLEQGDKLRHGVAIRPLLTIALISVGFRGVKVFGDGGETLGEISVLVKLPFPVAQTSEHYRDAEPAVDPNERAAEEPPAQTRER